MSRPPARLGKVQLQIMQLLWRYGRATARQIFLRESGLTRLVDRLVERGYLERRACESDRRGQLIVLTAEGRRAFRHAAPNVVRAIGTFFGGHFTERDATALRAACERIATAAETITPRS